MTFGQFFQQNLLLFFMLAGVIGAIISLEIRDRGKTGKKIDNAQAAISVNNGSVLIDLRSATDYKNAHISGAVNLPVEGLVEALDRKLKGKKNKTVILYDNDGLATGKQAKQLAAAGYTDIQILSAGFGGWIDENLPVVQK